jgi:hypothetical protein
MMNKFATKVADFANSVAGYTITDRQISLGLDIAAGTAGALMAGVPGALAMVITKRGIEKHRTTKVVQETATEAPAPIVEMEIEPVITVKPNGSGSKRGPLPTGPAH